MDLSSLLLLPWKWYLLWAFMIPVLLTIIPPKPYRAYISCTILFAILIKAQFFYLIDPLSNKNTSIALILQGVLINLFFYTFNLFFLVEYPELTDFRPKIETLNQVKNLKPCTWEKFIWCINRSILVTLLGHGWNWQISDSKLPIPFKYKNNLNWLKYFFFKKILIGYTIFDFFFQLYLSTDYIKTKGWGKNNINDLILFSKNSNLSIKSQILLAFGSVYCIYFGIEILYNIFVFINIFLLRNSSINDYPNLFGNFKNNFTIKSLWGNVWHKLMYQLAVPQSKFLVGCDYKAKHLNKKPRFGNEIWRKYLMFLMVFVFTGIFHASGTLNMPWLNGERFNINTPFKNYLPKFASKCFFSFIFFPCQFFLIIIENLIQFIWKKYINIKLPKFLYPVIGLTWIGLSEIYLLQLYIDELVKSGFDINELLIPYTPIHLLFKYFNIKL